MDIVIWLRSLGLGKYEAILRENDIDETVLLTLTAEDLKELGVTSFGHRRKLVDAIAALRNEASVQPASIRLAPARPSTATPTAASVAEAVGERRHVTVMFCDLVDSTGISAKLDAEEWRDLVGAYLDAALTAVTEMGGNVAKKLSDGLMALFGYPTAQENDAERAVRASLSIQRGSGRIESQERRRRQARTGSAHRYRHWPGGARTLVPTLSRSVSAALHRSAYGSAPRRRGLSVEEYHMVLSDKLIQILVVNDTLTVRIGVGSRFG